MILVTSLIRWKKEGFVPSHDPILALTADEEEYEDENGVAWLLKNEREAIDAEYALNADAGDFLTKGHRPYQVTLSAAEKKGDDRPAPDDQSGRTRLATAQGQRDLRAHRGLRRVERSRSSCCVPRTISHLLAVHMLRHGAGAPCGSATWR